MTPLPRLWGVLYASPNKDGERKSCSMCACCKAKKATKRTGDDVELCRKCMDAVS